MSRNPISIMNFYTFGRMSYILDDKDHFLGKKGKCNYYYVSSDIMPPNKEKPCLYLQSYKLPYHMADNSL